MSGERIAPAGRTARRWERLLDSGTPLRTHPIDAFIDQNLVGIVLLLVAAIVGLLAAVIWLGRRTQRLDARLTGLTRGSEGRSLEAVLEAHLEQVHDVARQVQDVSTRTAFLEGAQRKAFSRVGLVRYNPFEETGGNQSFALALLDANGDGWVLSSLHARSGTRVYAKAIAGGRSEAALSDEEAEAIKQATA